MISTIASITVPLIAFMAACIGIHKNIDIYSALIDGVKDGLKITVSILPSLIILISAIHILRASGFVDAITAVVTPVMRFLGIPPETTPLILLRPFSGSGALAIGSEIISKYGADSVIGRTAAVMLGSTETTFYVISIYFGSLGTKKLRHTIPAALAADIAGFIIASLTVRLLW